MKVPPIEIFPRIRISRGKKEVFNTTNYNQRKLQKIIKNQQYIKKINDFV